MNIISTQLILAIVARVLRALIADHSSHNMRHARIIALLEMFRWLTDRRRDGAEYIFDELGMMITYVLTMEQTHQEVKEALRLVLLTVVIAQRDYPSVIPPSSSIDDIPF